jgi:hypothetical protein
VIAVHEDGVEGSGEDGEGKRFLYDVKYIIESSRYEGGREEGGRERGREGRGVVGDSGHDGSR